MLEFRFLISFFLSEQLLKMQLSKSRGKLIFDDDRNDRGNIHEMPI